jgi:hypothetical protein
MADIGIKKATVLAANLPKLENPPANTVQEMIEQGQYLVRYRVVSEDRNRRSHWSRIYYVNPITTQDEES